MRYDVAFICDIMLLLYAILFCFYSNIYSRLTYGQGTDVEAFNSCEGKILVSESNTEQTKVDNGVIFLMKFCKYFSYFTTW